LISYKTGGYITAGIALVMMPWKILETTQGYIFTWLIGYSALLGPIAGILIIDYYFIRRTQINVPALYEEHGQYSYRKGWNMTAVIAFVIGVAPNIPGFLNAAFPASFPEVSALLKTIYTLCLVCRSGDFRYRVFCSDAQSAHCSLKYSGSFLHQIYAAMLTSSICPGFINIFAYSR
jgi:cytosine/uracil/thiamine/allantoin permease